MPQNKSLAQFSLNVLKAAVHFIRRQDRAEHPEGKFDNGGRWYPKGKDAESFDYNVRTPSRAFPYSYMHHARTAKHVAALHNVDEKQVKSAARLMRKMRETE